MVANQCFIYCRQSSGQEESDNSTSIQQQIENCMKCAAQHQLTVADIFTDANVSGKTYPSGEEFEKIAAIDPSFTQWFAQQSANKKFRTGLGNMLRRLAEVDYIVLDEITRLHRSTGRSFLEQTIHFAITEKKIKIIQVKGEAIDLSKFDQNLIQILKSQINDEQIANQKRKSIESRIRIKDGGIITHAKFFAGVYDGNKKFHYEPEKADAVKYIFHSIAGQVSYGQICYELNHHWRHLFAPAKMVYESTVHHIARNPVYAGYMYNSEAELIPCRNSPTPLIELELFDRVQVIMDRKRMLNARPRADAYQKHFLPFSGLLKCGHCGAALLVNIDRGKIFYLCRHGVLAKNPLCRRSRILINYIDDSIPGLKDAVTPLLLLALLERYKKIQWYRASVKNLEELNTQILHLKHKLSTAFSLFCDDVFDENTYTEITRERMAEVKTLQSRQKELKFHAACDFAGLERELQYRIDFFLANPRNLPHEAFLELLHESIREITVHPSRIILHTIAGAFELNRLAAERNRKILSDWSLSRLLPPDRTTIHIEETHFDLLYFDPTLPARTLATFGNFTIRTRP